MAPETLMTPEPPARSSLESAHDYLSLREALEEGASILTTPRSQTEAAARA
jgi:hypothetical protein